MGHQIGRLLRQDRSGTGGDQTGVGVGKRPRARSLRGPCRAVPSADDGGDYCEYGFCIAGDVRCHGGKFTHVDKSKEFEAEIEAWQTAISKEHEDEFYADLLKYAAGEPNGIIPGRIGETKAKIAKVLISEDPGLVAPERRTELMQKIESIYDRDHAVYVTLSEEEIGLALMVATHEDDLGRA
jgi:hypothetical protein